MDWKTIYEDTSKLARKVLPNELAADHWDRLVKVKRVTHRHATGVLMRMMADYAMYQ